MGTDLQKRRYSNKSEQTIIKHGSPGQIKTRPIKTRFGEKLNKTDNSKGVD